MNQRTSLLICDDDPIFHTIVKKTLKNEYALFFSFEPQEALAQLKNKKIDLMLLDIKFKEMDEGLKAIPLFLSIDPNLAIMITSGLKDFYSVRESLRLGALDYFLKDFSQENLKLCVQQALLRKNRIQHIEGAKQALDFNDSLFLGHAPCIQKVRSTLEKIKNTSANILIIGESGTGKELIAKQLRRNLQNGQPEPFITIDSSTIQTAMAESILFGHEKGAFTGAERSQSGVFEQVNGGTIYFDEISNMPLEIQNKLLRVLQEQEIKKLGSHQVIRLKFRVICATNQDLKKMIKNQQFKFDLFHRIQVLSLHLPPLREHVEDIPLLVDFFLKNQTLPDKNLCFSAEAMEALQTYDWPGNVRELKNFIQSISILHESHTIEYQDLPIPFQKKRMKKNVHQTFYERVETFEKMILKKEYQKHQGKISSLAKALKMDRSHLYLKLKKWNLHQKKS